MKSNNRKLYFILIKWMNECCKIVNGSVSHELFNACSKSKVGLNKNIIFVIKAESILRQNKKMSSYFIDRRSLKSVFFLKMPKIFWLSCLQHQYPWLFFALHFYQGPPILLSKLEFLGSQLLICSLFIIEWRRVQDILNRILIW